MQITVERDGEKLSVACAAGQTVLEALAQANISVASTCGGRGICGKCQVMVRRDNESRWVLACQEKVSEGLEVLVEHNRALVVQQKGDVAATASFPLDPDARGLGMAVDIGTTTVVAHLHDRATGTRLATVGHTNPQAVFGADVISRITASAEGKLSAMTSRIVEMLVDMRGELCRAAFVDERACTLVSVAGNTVMEHIFCGLPPDPIGASPFTPLSLFGDAWDIPRLGTCYVAPAVAGYVGGDITAGLLARGFGSKEKAAETALFLDLGTNGEMALEHDGKIACCATAAGPVFEGAGIEFGMPAALGAISRVRIEDGRVAFETVGNADPVGICGTGIVDAVAALLDAGIVDETGYMLGADELDGALAGLVGEEHGANAFYLTDDHTLYVSQRDVRNVQLAKAAVCAGVHVLLDRFGIGVGDVGSVEIAGGFGAFLNSASAARIGLFPATLRDRAISVGNASAEGATALLLSEEARVQVQKLAESCDYVGLSTSPEFNGFYIEQMGFEEE